VIATVSASSGVNPVSAAAAGEVSSRPGTRGSRADDEYHGEEMRRPIGQTSAMPRQWELIIDEVFAFDRDLGTFIAGRDQGDLIESGDWAQLLSRDGVLPVSHVGFHGQAVGHVRLTLQGVDLEQVAVGDRLIGMGDVSLEDQQARPPVDGDPRVPAMTEQLEALAWQARAHAGRGSSGRWTAGFDYLPLSFGGASTEAEAMQGLRQQLAESLEDETKRESALRLVLRWRGADPEIDARELQ
jgi:hypothetical protein